MRGEYRHSGRSGPRYPELPPRARRIHLPGHRHQLERGTTSACAENTIGFGPPFWYPRNYLRVRGEYICPNPMALLSRELPPRARRIPTIPTTCSAAVGTTSACAENTIITSGRSSRRRNYLRVRGEYNPQRLPLAKSTELPPRARRIQSHAGASWHRSGTTSACAENTLNELGLL